MWRYGEPKRRNLPTREASILLLGGKCLFDFDTFLWRYGDPLFHNKISFIWYTSLFKNQRVLTREFLRQRHLSILAILVLTHFSSIQCWGHQANSHGRRLTSTACSELILARHGQTPSRANFSTAWRSTILCYFSFFKTVLLWTVLRPRSVQYAVFLVQILFQEISVNCFQQI